MLKKSGHVKITDFGIAQLKSEEAVSDGIVGSPSYMSPEQVKEKPVPVQKIRPEVPGILAKIIKKAIAKDPGKRYQTCGGLCL